MEARYDYASYKTYERASDALEDMFASGDVTQGERPKIEPRRSSPKRPVERWVITLPM